MPNYILTVLDTPGIQPYIFGSNRLRENIGASELVRLATGQWALELLQERETSNVMDPRSVDPAQRLNEHCIEDGALTAEVLYVGGGNTLILFTEIEHARAFVTALSRRLLEEAPGLQLAAAHVTVPWEQNRMRNYIDAAMRQLARHKATHPPALPLLGLGVTASCNSTGLVATTTSAQHGAPGASYLVSDAVAAKLDAVGQADARLRRVFPDDIRRAGYEFPHDFDDFGRSEEEMSYIAVVHADGNQMGRFFRGIDITAKTSRAFIHAMREASVKVAQTASAAFGDMVSAVLGAIEVDEDGYYIPTNKTPIRLTDGKLPFRPLVFGGDDVTFVCDGRLGIDLAAQYLNAFEVESRARGLDLHACAGIAVVKSHYPFARAYALSEDLTRNAKRYVRKEIQDDASALDWHFAASGLLGKLEAIREREYTAHWTDEGRHITGNLHLRPLSLADHNWRSWSRFVRMVGRFQALAESQRNKVVGFREALRDGPEVARKFIEAYGIGDVLEDVDHDVAELVQTGWHSECCGYFDGVEALDFYVPLAGGKDEHL